MKSKSLILLFFLSILLLTACKKEKDVKQAAIDIRCTDFESWDCVSQYWACGLVDKMHLTEASYNGTKCLLIITDSFTPAQNVYTYVSGFDSNQVYRLSFYAKYKKVLAHLPYQGHFFGVSMPSSNMSFAVVTVNNNSNDPIVRDWEKYMVLFQAKQDIPGQLTFSITDMDSVWIDDVVIDKF